MNYYNSDTLLEQQQEIQKLKDERDAYLAELQKANAVIIDLQRNPPKMLESCLRQVRADAVEKAVALYTHKFGSDDATNEVGLNIIRRFGEYIHPEGLREYVKQIMAGTDEDTSILAGKE